ncbi:MAG TPA: CoA ester lyase [Thermoanaerobaculia bacterium]|jgi:(S)-citramalyl-CoA lyase|nr:CoA ester lyase [Thermoanaerobaculia bacterium]
MKKTLHSVLVTCALKTDQYHRAAECGASLGLIDLEDSVPLGQKENARRLALPFLAGQQGDGYLHALRINSVLTQEGMRDLLALRDSGTMPDAVLLPKVESPDEIGTLEALLGRRFEQVGILPIIESPGGICAVDEIARVSPRIWGLIFGAADFSSAMGTTQAWDNMVYARSRIVAAARRAGVQAIDSPCFDLHHEETVWTESERARDLGFQGKIAIHPKHVPVLNQVFSGTVAGTWPGLAGGELPF